jgi:hypothetical protein
VEGTERTHPPGGAADSFIPPRASAPLRLARQKGSPDLETP